MNRKKIAVIDLTTNKSRHSLYGRVMYPNFASIMPQAIAVWSRGRVEQKDTMLHLYVIRVMKI